MCYDNKETANFCEQLSGSVGYARFWHYDDSYEMLMRDAAYENLLEALKGNF